MGQILPTNWRVLSATLLAAALVVGAYVLARGVRSPSLAEASTESALLQAIATRDTDGDGLPDWEEALYGTDSHITDTNQLGMTDGAAVAKGLIVPKAIADIPVPTTSPPTVDTDGLPPPPAEGTLTAAFTNNFIGFYLAAVQANGGAELSDVEMQNIANQTIQSLSSIATIAPDFKSLKDLKVSGSGTEALAAFAADAEQIFLKNKANATATQLTYLKYAIDNGDTNALTHISSIAKAYRDGAVGLSALSVPQELAAPTLALVNALMRISQITNDFTLINTDPLAAMLALEQYVDAVQSLGDAFASIGSVYTEAGVALPPGTPGAVFVSGVEGVAAKKQDAPKQ